MSTATAAESQASTNSDVPPEANAPVSTEPIYFAPVLAGFDWLSEFELGNAVMDETHHEFVELLDGLIRASDEDFPPMHCHQAQHDNVLAAVRDVRERVACGDIIIGRYLAEQIAEWFPSHADMMDRALARWIDFMQQGGAALRAGGVPDLGCGSGCGSHSEEGHSCSSGEQSGCGGSGCDCD